MTNAGPHQYRQNGWNNNDPEDEDHWNRGVSFPEAYEKSYMLKNIFPDGNNRFTDEDGNLLDLPDPNPNENPHNNEPLPSNALSDPLQCVCTVTDNQLGRGCSIIAPGNSSNPTNIQFFHQSGSEFGCESEASCSSYNGHILNNSSLSLIHI